MAKPQKNFALSLMGNACHCSGSRKTIPNATFGDNVSKAATFLFSAIRAYSGVTSDGRTEAQMVNILLCSFQHIIEIQYSPIRKSSPIVQSSFELIVETHCPYKRFDINIR